MGMQPSLTGAPFSNLVSLPCLITAAGEKKKLQERVAKQAAEALWVGRPREECGSVT